MEMNGKIGINFETRHNQNVLYMILYFSGTGNSKWVAERIVAAFGDVAVSMEKSDGIIDISEGEMFGIVTPTHWWELPAYVREFLSRAVFGKTIPKYSFIVATYGTTPGCTYEDARRILACKGISTDAGFGVKMPDTWTPLFDLSDSEDVARQNREAERYIDAAIDGIRQRLTGNRMEKKIPYAVRIFTDPLLNSERKTKNFYVEDQCIGCGLCAGRCPVQAIEIREKRPVWVKKQCTLCFRCLHFCPKFAIQYGCGRTKKHGQYRNPNTKI